MSCCNFSGNTAEKENNAEQQLEPLRETSEIIYYNHEDSWTPIRMVKNVFKNTFCYLVYGRKNTPKNVLKSAVAEDLITVKKVENE